MNQADMQSQLAEYEQPLSERMRTFLRLEFLYQRYLYYDEQTSAWATRGSINTLLDMQAILMRGDVRSEIHKELDLQIDAMQVFQSRPGVDGSRLDSVIQNLLNAKTDIDAIGSAYMQPLKESEFLNAIKHRSSIPGGTCEFDLPEYSHWLRQPADKRRVDTTRWLNTIRPICDAICEVLWLIRESAEPEVKMAERGMYQQRIDKNSYSRMLRVKPPAGKALYPEISGNPKRFTIRFLEWSDLERRAVQTDSDIEFTLSIC